MDILYSSSDSYAFLTGISILSLLENNRECDAIHIYIMDNHISDINKNKLIEVVKEYRRDMSSLLIVMIFGMMLVLLSTFTLTLQKRMLTYLYSLQRDTMRVKINILISSPQTWTGRRL